MECKTLEPDILRVGLAFINAEREEKGAGSQPFAIIYSDAGLIFRHYAGKKYKSRNKYKLPIQEITHSASASGPITLIRAPFPLTTRIQYNARVAV